MSTPAVEPSGILLINKHAGATSHDIVYKVRRAMHTKRVGHTGTLDPMATGVLVVLVGRCSILPAILMCNGESSTPVSKWKPSITTSSI